MALCELLVLGSGDSALLLDVLLLFSSSVSSQTRSLGCPGPTSHTLGLRTLSISGSQGCVPGLGN